MPASEWRPSDIISGGVCSMSHRVLEAQARREASGDTGQTISGGCASYAQRNRPASRSNRSGNCWSWTPRTTAHALEPWPRPALPRSTAKSQNYRKPDPGWEPWHSNVARDRPALARSSRHLSTAERRPRSDLRIDLLLNGARRRRHEGANRAWFRSTRLAWCWSRSTRRSEKRSASLELAGAAGFEPANGGTKSRCLTTWRRPNSRALIGATRRLERV